MSATETGFYVASYLGIPSGEGQGQIKTGNGPSDLRHSGTNSEQFEEPEAENKASVALWLIPSPVM